jgi:hypothetical protein
MTLGNANAGMTEQDRNTLKRNTTGRYWWSGGKAQRPWAYRTEGEPVLGLRAVTLIVFTARCGIARTRNPLSSEVKNFKV